VAERFFEPDEVEALIPTLTEIMDALMRAHGEGTEIRERVKEEQRRIAMSGGAFVDRHRLHADAQALERLTAEVRAGVDRIVALGGVVKDLGMGLVDFPHELRGREVNLCWKYGEHEIRYWHGLDEGFAARKPLEGSQR
jgi:hypothetical protein